jgi:hypothetical protein
LVALPAALAVGGLSLWILRGRDADPPPPPPPAATGGRNAGPVTMDAPRLSPRAATVCRAVVAALPESTSAGRRRPVSDGPDQNAAYGDPPVTLTCGTPAVSVPPEATVAGLNGVCWYGRAGGTGTVWTTVDREIPVAVTVPGADPDGTGQVVIPFSAAVAAADPRIEDPPSGCP